MQDISIVLQTGFAKRFSQAGLDSIAFHVLWMFSSVVLPVSCMVLAPVSLIIAKKVEVVVLPAIIAALLLLLLAALTSARDLAVAEARMGTEQLAAIGASFLSSHLSRMSEKVSRGVAKSRGSSGDGVTHPPAHQLLTGWRGAWITPRL